MVIDAFIFNNELDLLELRLGQLDEVVDKFVFIENDQTFMGQPKEHNYLKNRSLFEKWNHKIICGSLSIPRSGDGWKTEAAHREALVNLIYAQSRNPQDILSFSDLDEIPNPEAVKSYTPAMGLRNLKQYTFYYNYNNLMDYGNRAWSRARIGTVGDIAGRGGMANFRGGPGDMSLDFPCIENGGWHGSYFHQDVEKIRQKVLSISHDDLHGYIRERTPKQLATDMAAGEDLFHRHGIGTGTFVSSDDDRLPPYFRQNKERFRKFTREYFVELNKSLLEG